ncbi:hypothetical protein DSC45_15550 [Streptomyces sp. YIM 130001]|uniref:TY-Chap domain-containing protein n=1 Tax=Streptomyces sp. YIM 130001 TaxID=2259644 RepID=UPI000E64BB60|nr:hypothetical protein [Streptomyces sp. YIM 130001]RII16001.1 hypothetical protein DSC45_15550 [Streptomyces sp. YIM 130001]
MSKKQTQPWSEFRTRLREEVAALSAGDSLLVAEPDPAGGPAPDEVGPRRWRRRPKPRRGIGRYVQFLRWDEGIGAECVSRSYRDTTDEQQRRLLGLGWSDPRDHPPRSGRSDNHEMWFGLDEVDRPAEICEQSLRILGDEAPDERWTWQQDPPAGHGFRG